MTAPETVDVLVVGAGFAGMRALHALRGQGMSVVVLEAGDDVGGVWYWNRYPGARCDVESYDYSYSFSEELEQEWRWNERFAAQPEILRYAQHVADHFGLRRDIVFGQQMTSATYDEQAARWTVTTHTGCVWDAQFLVMAVGNLSATKAPDIAGLDIFAGRVFHTARWPHEPVDLTGLRVGVIGTGSSGAQLIPIVAQQTAHLTVFQRSANFSIPACNGPVSDERDAEVKAAYAERRAIAQNSPSGLGFMPDRASAAAADPEERRARFEQAWAGAGFGFLFTYHDLLLDEASNATAAEFCREKIAAIVKDPRTRELLTPHGFPFGGKRPSVDSGYFETFNRDNVMLVDLRATPIRDVTPTSLRTTDAEYPLDVLILATGFDAFTGALLRPDITGRGGHSLREAWSTGPRTYLGLGVAGFPNLFVIAGPGSPSLLSNVLLSIEHHVDWLAVLLRTAVADGIVEIEATEEAQDRWVEHVNRRAQETLYPRAPSYYMGDDLPGKPRVFMPYSGGVRDYRRILEQVERDGYEGFALRRSLLGETVPVR